MFGLVVVVFVGIGLSLAVDRRFSFSSSVSTLESEIKSDGLELEHLREIHRKRSWDLTKLEPERETDRAALAAFQKRAADLELRRKHLVSERGTLRSSIPLLKEEFARYRVKYRESARHAAIGESLGTLTTLGGREYRDVFISRVTAIGLEVRHEHGSARLKASELDVSLRNRFQWDDEERKTLLNEGNAIQETEDNSSNVAGNRNESPKAAPSHVDDADLAERRRKVIAWRARVALLRSEMNAASNAAYGPRKSPPGSLETWQARAGRLGVELAKAEGELAAAKAALAVIAPHDGLLKPAADGVNW